MSLKSRIEQELLTLSSANFQKLGDSYLRHNRGWRLQSWGTMVGADKDKTGIPDSYCQLPDNRFVLVGYTTTAPSKLLAKLSDDLSDCIEEAQALNPPAEVECIALVFNNLLPLAGHHKLTQQAQQQGYKVELFSLDEMVAMVLAYPPLAADLLSLDLGRGELLAGPEFVAAYGRQLGATPLVHTLYGRDDEQQDLKQKLANSDVVLVSGSAGVGKTQLVVTTCQEYCNESPDARQLYYVYDKKSKDFSKELQFMLTPGKQVIIVVDDANRVSPYLSVLIQEQRLHPAGTLKIVATVRDYAREMVQGLVQHTYHTEIELKPLADEHITTLLKAEPYTILNPRYLTRILELSNGRPRLAIMVASAAKKTQSLATLHNVADIYELYFGPVLADLEASPNPQLLKVAALIHFFRVIGQKDDSLIENIERAFGIAPATFWECAQALHNAELVEMYEDRIVRSSDQILGNFIFYRVFFGPRRLLKYEDLLITFFRDWHRRASDTFAGIVNDFDYEVMKPKIAPALKAWLRQPVIDDKDRWQFFRTFWPYLRTEIISYSQNGLVELPWPAFSPVTYKVNTDTNLPYVDESPALEALELIATHPVEEQPNAIQLLIELAAKMPEQFNKVLRLLRKLIGFNGDEYDRYGLHTLTTTLKVLQAATYDHEHGEFARWMLQHTIPAGLATSFQGVRSGREANSIMICTYNVPFQEDAQAWREQLWQQLAELCAHNATLTVAMFGSYLNQSHDNRFTGSHEGENLYQWQKWDSQYAIPILTSNLKPANFAHCKLVNEYYYWLERRASLPEMQQLKAAFSQSSYRLYDLLIFDQRMARRSDKSFLRFHGTEAAKFLRERLKPLAYKKLKSYQQLIDRIHAMHAEIGLDDYEKQQLGNSFASILHEVLERQPKLGAQVVAYLLSTGNPMSSTPWQAIESLAAVDYEAGYELITSYAYEAKSMWRWLYLRHLPASIASDYWLNELYQAAAEGLYRYDFNGLQVYESLAPSLYPNLLTRALDYAATATHGIYFYYGLIAEFNKFFSDAQLDILKRLYAWEDEHQQHFDYNSEQLACLVERDPSHLLEYSRKNRKKRGFISRYDSRKLEFLWKSDKYFPELLTIIKELAEHHSRFEEKDIADALFPATHEENEQRLQESFLSQAIVHFSGDTAAIGLLFAIIREQLPKQLIAYLSELLPHTSNNLALLKELPLFPSSRTTGSSWVPVYQQEQQLWRDVLELVDAQVKLTGDLFKYRAYVLQQIDYLDRSIADENERNFASPY